MRTAVLTVLAALLVLSLQAYAIVDSPIPPGIHPAPPSNLPVADIARQIPQKMGYCVNFDIDNALLGTVNVPLHKPNAYKLDELRGSLFMAGWHVLEGLHAKAARETDPGIRAAITAQADNLFHRLTKGVFFVWEQPTYTPAVQPGIVSPEYRPVQGGGGGLVCTCATKVDDTVVPGPPCRGACGDCYICS